MQIIWIYVGNQICCGFDMREFKLNRVNAWIIPSKHVVECKRLKDNYSSSLKSMSKTLTFLDHTYHDSHDGICE